MTLLKIDGFDGYGRADVGKFWEGGYADTSAVIGAQGRRGGNCLYSLTSNTYSDYRLRYYPENQDDTLIIGWAYKNTGSIQNGSEIFQMYNPGSPADPGIRITCIGGGLNFQIVRQYGYNYQTATLLNFALEWSNWYFLEVKVKGGTSDGLFEFRINEQVQCSFTNIDNVVVNATNGIQYVDIVNGNYSFGHVDDVYILNTSGSENNDYLGDIRVDTVKPNGAGNYTQFIPSAGNNYECVDDAQFDDSDYVEEQTAGEKDSYSYADVPTDLDDLAIFGIQVNTACKRTEAAITRKMKNFLRTGGADYEDSTARDLNDDFKSMETIWENDPSDSNPWTQAKINACEFGMEVN